MKKLFSASLMCLSLIGGAASGADRYSSSNPFIEAMIRMMQIFGLIDSTRWPLATPYSGGLGGMPGVGGLSALGGYPALSSMYGMSAVPGFGGMSAVPGLGGMTAVPGLGGMTAVPGLGGMTTVPGLGGMTAVPGLGGMTGVPGMSAVPGMQGIPGMPQTSLPGIAQMPQWPSTQPRESDQNRLNGIWELNKGGFVIIRGRMARLYLSREKFQDFIVGFDQTHVWWVPRTGGTQSRYRYRMQDNRMILADDKGGYLLLRRQR